MVTYQDFLAVGENETERMAFIRTAVNQYKASAEYRFAVAADLYDKRQNPDIANFTKTIYTVTGKAVPDAYASNYKVGRAFFPFFVTQEVQYLLSNGVTWEKGDTSERLGTKRYEFDTQLQKAAHDAIVQRVAYGLWNLDHMDVFSALEFMPLHDEDTGALRAGIRFWQIDAKKPFRATLYEEEGYTDYIWNKRVGEQREDGMVLHERRPYVIRSSGAEIDEDKIYTGENYPAFPIVPLWGNKQHQSELVGLREQIFVYDVIKSGFCDTVEEASYIYWAISNAPGMDERALAEFTARVKRIHAAVTEDSGSTATPHQLEAPTDAREKLLDRLEKDLIKDAMAFDPDRVAGGIATATQIRASYNLLDMKVNDFEYCLLSFISGILELAGIEDNPTFTRDRNINVAEEIQAIMQAASTLDDEYVTRKIMTLLGDGDQAEEMIARRIADELSMIPEGGGMNGEE